jgi:hypothetical protein
MAVQPVSIDRLKSQLMGSGLSRTDNTLFQIISGLIDAVRQSTIATTEAIASGGGGSSSGITSLTTDVVAVGPGAVVATIQPGVVIYAKIQDTTLADILIGRSATPGTVEEIELGANLQIVAGTLEITTSGGGSGGGLAHNLLSATHPDTLAADPVEGDIVYAGAGIIPAGTYISPQIISSYSEAFEGIRMGMGPFSGGYITPICSPLIATPFISYAAPTLLEFLPTPDVPDGYIRASIVEDFEGIRAGSIGVIGVFTLPGTGNYGHSIANRLAMIPLPSLEPVTTDGIWRRLPVGNDGQVLTIVNGIPDWEDLPPIPDEPAYPWNDITFDAADFTATGGGGAPTWTVAAGDVARWQYQQFPGLAGVGNNVRIALYIKTSSVAGVGPPTRLLIELPFLILGEYAQFISMRENSVAVTDVAVGYDDSVSTSHLIIEKVPFGGAFDVTANETYVAFEISAVLQP